MRIAAFQRFPIFDDSARASNVLVRDLLWAEAHGVELALFPECYLLGHSYDRPTIEARAISMDGEPWRSLLARLAPITTTAVIGTFERQGGAITNSAIVVEQGRVTGRYAKAHPNEAGIRPGTAFPLFERSAVRYGINICNDANFPETAQRIADQGAALICYPLNNMLKPETAAKWRSRSVENLQARARQTGCWIMSADVTGQHDGLVSYGCTMVVRPDGVIVARATESEEGLAVFDLPDVTAGGENRAPGACGNER
jgi:predicted amidohydrolase